MAKFEFIGTIRSRGVTSPCEIRITPPQMDGRGLHYCTVELSFPRPRRTDIYGATADQAEALARNYLAVNLRGMVLIGPDGGALRHPFTEMEAIADTQRFDDSEGKARRGDVGLLITLVRSGDQARLVFDDVEPSGKNGQSLSWQIASSYTANDYTAKDLLSSSLSESQLADIGLAVIARLAARENNRSGS